MHANNLINKEMYESLLSFKNEIGLYFTIIKYTFYFIIGALSFYILNKFKILILFLIKMFKRNELRKNMQNIFKIIFFIILSTIAGWLIIKILF